MLQIPENDPRVMACAAQLLARFSTRLIHPPRLPRRHELAVLDELSRSVKIPFAPPGDAKEDPANVALLRRLWFAAFGPDEPFVRFSRRWRKLGFQHDRDPASDFRGGGRLSLECLVYLVERHPSIARGMLAKRCDRTARRGPYANYPWACGGITVCKKLCELLGVCQPLTGRASGAFRDTAATFWHVAGSKTIFFELFVWSFTGLDGLWDDLGATYMDFPRVIAASMQRTADVLHRLPNDVVPSARSHAGSADAATLFSSDKFACGFEEDTGPLLGDDDGDSDEEEEEEESKVDQYHLPAPELPSSEEAADESSKAWCRDDAAADQGASRDLRCTEYGSDRLEDLLGLAHFSSDRDVDRVAPAADFFAEYGLTP